MTDHTPAAARNIAAAFDERYELCGPFDSNWQQLCLAAALRALVAPYRDPLTLLDESVTISALDVMAIANELEINHD